MIVLTLIIGIILYFIIKRIFEVKNYPPGPYPFPIVGNALQLGNYAKKTGSLLGAFKYCKKQYGDIFTLHFGPFPIVMICDYELAIEAMVKYGHLFVDRWENPTFASIRNYRGLATSSGEYSLEQRRFALRTLRDLGVSRNLMENRILEEWHARFDNVDPEKRFAINEIFDPFTAAIIHRLLFSDRVDEEQEAQFTTMKNEMEASMGKLSFLDTMIPPWALNFSYIKNRVANFLKPTMEFKYFLERQLKERISAVENGTHEITGEPNDFVDAFIVEMKKQEKEGIATAFTLETLVCDTFDLFRAGQDTTSTTLAWAICYLLNHDDVTQKIRKELLTVTSGNRDLSQADKSKTPYFNATICEIQRLASIITTNLQRLAADDLEIGGITIKKGTAVTAQLSMIMSDEKYFPEPEKFKPERFLNPDRSENQTVPFGLGKRACLGESLARAELYLTLGNLIQKYKFEAVDGVPEMKERNPMSPLRKPPQFLIRLLPVE